MELPSMSMCQGVQAVVMSVFGGVAEGEEVARNQDETPGPHGVATRFYQRPRKLLFRRVRICHAVKCELVND